ncbi:MAG TPA: MotA/TolQ/ExbB proton channel family protein [Limnobacter sp.]|nr:MotA/TolQ/ExbB proton channel family protein [Limnobacter sp.]
MTQHNPHQLFLQWALLTSLTFFGLYISWDKGLLQWVIITDNTRICAIILAVFVAGTLFAGWRSLYLGQQSIYFDQVCTGKADLKQGQSFCHDYLSKPLGHPSEGGLLAEVMAEKARGPHQLGWFTTSLMLKLGLLGTVVGFVMMLSSLEGLQELDISDIKYLMKQMTQGMGVAMNTTLVGLVGSILLGFQFLLLDRHADRLIAATVDHAHKNLKAD